MVNSQSPLQVPGPARSVRFGPFEADLHSGELRKHGRRIKLQDQPFQVLALLLEHPGEMVTREELRQKLWPADTFVDFDVGLNTAIKRLRDALSDRAESPRYVETLPRHGYRFIAQADGLAAATPPSGPAQIPTDRYTRRAVSALVDAVLEAHRARTRWRVGAMVAGATVLALVVVLLGVRGLRQRVQGSPKIQSLAVLPLENLSGDPSQEYFADGMTDALITDLAQISSLRVISRTSVMRYKGTRKLLPEIAKELNVDGIVEGAVVRSGERVRVDAQLIQASTDRHLWARTYERSLGDVMTLQSEVTRAIANEIQVQLTPQDQARLARTQPVDPQAYEFYLKGRYFWNKRSDEGIRKAMDYMNQAIAKDQSYALAYAGLADCYALGPPGDFTKGKAAAIRAIELDPLLAEPHAALAKFREGEFDWAGAESEYKRAIELNPNYATGRQWYALLLAGLGRLEKAREQIQMARGLDPLSLPVRDSVAVLYLFAHQLDLAIEELHKILEMDPNFSNALAHLVVAYEAKGMYREAAAEWRQDLLNSDREGAAAWENVTDEASYRRAVARVLALRKEQAKKEYVNPLLFAHLYVRLGENEQALAWLEKAYQQHSRALLYLRWPLYYDPLHSDPRFQDLVRRVGLPP